MFQVAINDISRGCQELIHDTANTMRNQFLRSIAASGCSGETFDTIKEHIDESYSQLFNPFEKIRSGYFQQKFLVEEMNCIKPKIIQLGERVEERVRGCKRQAVVIPENMYYVPIKSSVEQLLQNELMHGFISTPVRAKNEHFIMDLPDGTSFNNHPLFGKRPNNCIQIEMYYDDVEYCSALSSKKKKLALFYYRIGNIPAIYRSKLPAVRMLATVDNNFVKKYGMMQVLRPIVDDLIILTEEGWDFNIKGQDEHFCGALHLILGDTPASNSLTGFKEGVGRAYDCCRLCQCVGKHGQTHFSEEDFHLMDLDQYLWKCDHLERAQDEAAYIFDHLSKQFGINRRSILTEIPEFDLTEFTPYDLMHVFNEGILPFVIKEILKEWILDGPGKLFSMSSFNNNLEDFFTNFRADSFQRPTTITQNMLYERESTLHQTASTMATLVIALPFILHDLVDPENDYFKLLMQLIEIYYILFSTVFTTATLEKLKELIKEHLQKFKELFPEKSLIPKQHFMVHFPSIIEKHGPPFLYNTGRFETNHQDSKKKIIARQNYINVAKSTCDSEVRQEAVQIQCEDPKEYALFKDDFLHGKLTTPNEDKKLYFMDKIATFCNIDGCEIQNVYVTNHLTLGTLKMFRDYTFVAVEARENKLQFGLVKEIFIVNNKNTFLEIKMYDTIEHTEHLNAFEVEAEGAIHIQDPDMPAGHIFMRPENLLDVNPYYVIEVDDKLYIPTYFDVTALVSLAESGNGQLNNNLSDLV